jgi:hypothetical protein
MAKIEYDEVQKKIFSFTPVGRAYMEYNERVGGEPFGYTIGMDVVDIDATYGGLVGLYNECIKQGKTWEEILGISGSSDEIPEE